MTWTGRAQGLLVLLMATTVTVASAAPGAARAIESLAGARTRIVWVQDHSQPGNDSGAQGQELRLMGLDTQDGLGERPILPDLQNYFRPLLTPDGTVVVYTDTMAKEVLTVGFEGGNPTELTNGEAADVALDLAHGTVWVYVIQDGHRVVRIPLGAQREPEVVWDKTETNSFQVSLDCARAAGEFPHPHAGVAALPNGVWTALTKGCWPSMAPDNSYLAWVFDGPHRNVTMFRPGDPNGWLVNINDAPGIYGYEVYHPRWTNHVQFLTMTGPYTVGQRDNRIRGGGKQIEVYLGRFNADFTAVDYWLQVTRNNRPDFYPDIWIEGGEKASAMLTSIPVDPASGPPFPSWPGDQIGLLFAWEDASQENQVLDPDEGFRLCRVRPRGKAKLTRYCGMDLAEGAFLAEGVDDLLTARCRESGQLTVEAAIHPDSMDQDGPARIITFSSSAMARDFTLGQSGADLVFRLRTPFSGENGSTPQTTLYTMDECRPFHVVVTYLPGMTVCYIDGQPVFATTERRGAFRNWTPQHLVFGDEFDGDRDWCGTLDHIAIYDRAMGSDEVARHFDAYRECTVGRTPATQIRARLKGVEVSQVPDPASIAPYRQALVVNQYQVVQVEAGALDEQQILVAHWAIMDGDVLPSIGIPVETAGDFLLEPFDEHPELEGERLIMEVSGVDLPLFYEVTR